MNKFHLKKASSNKYYLFYEEKPFITSKGNNILIAQGGGPTNVINQSLCGIIIESKK